MDITYFGHSCFKLRGKELTVVMDPFSKKGVGFDLPSLSADIVTSSHDHADHSNISAVKGTSRREEPFVIKHPGEYEIMGASVFGVKSFHDNKNGEKRGKNTMFVVHIDGIAVGHLGDLGEDKLSDKQLDELGGIDVLLCPVGGVYTIGPKEAADIINAIQPSYVIPMHFKTKKHSDTFAKVSTLDDFLKEFGATEAKRSDKLAVSQLSLPEETEVLVLEV